MQHLDVSTVGVGDGLENWENWRRRHAVTASSAGGARGTRGRGKRVLSTQAPSSSLHEMEDPLGFVLVAGHPRWIPGREPAPAAASLRC